MLVYFSIAVIFIITVAWIYYQQKKSQKPQPPSVTSIPRNLFNLQIGDIVQYFDTDWFVEGLSIYDEEGYTWQEYLLQDGGRIAWLSVEEDDRLIVSLLEPTKELEITAAPAKTLIFAGETYRQSGSGRARMTRRLRASGQAQVLSCRYFDYEAPGQKVLSIENWNGEWEVMAGLSVSPRELRILPGDGQSVHNV